MCLKLCFNRLSVLFHPRFVGALHFPTSSAHCHPSEINRRRRVAPRSCLLWIQFNAIEKPVSVLCQPQLHPRLNGNSAWNRPMQTAHTRDGTEGCTHLTFDIIIQATLSLRSCYMTLAKSCTFKRLCMNWMRKKGGCRRGTSSPPS